VPEDVLSLSFHVLPNACFFGRDVGGAVFGRSIQRGLDVLIETSLPFQLGRRVVKHNGVLFASDKASHLGHPSVVAADGPTAAMFRSAGGFLDLDEFDRTHSKKFLGEFLYE
jgi:hypothetical protein